MRFVLYFIDRVTAEIYTLSLHDALRIYRATPAKNGPAGDGLSSYTQEPRSFPSRQSSIHSGSPKSIPGNLRTERAGEASLQHFQKEDRRAQSQGKRRHGSRTREVARTCS